MRKLIAALFAAVSIGTPVAAQRDPGAGGGFQPRGERMEQDRVIAREGVREVFGRRGERRERQEARQERRADRSDDRAGWRAERRTDRQAYRAERRADDRAFRQERREDVEALREGRVSPREFRRDRARDWRDFERDRRTDRRDFRHDRFEDRRGWNGGGWTRAWRQDRRYDWRGWRARNGGLYRLPRYVAPPGWGYGYRRFGLGVFLGAPLFASDYWLNDPWSFRLPPARGPYQWVRYFDDVLLVDTRSGYVVDAIHDFFW